MSFFSTRGGACVTASQSILWGLAADGGLYVPSLFPQISSERLAALCGQSYRQRAARILRDFLEDYSIAEIEQSVDAAYAADAWDHPDVAPVRTLIEGVHVLELFHGPTLAFKDIALKLLPYLVRLAAEKNGEKREVSIIVATSEWVFKRLETISSNHNVDFVISVSAGPEELPDFIKPYVI